MFALSPLLSSLARIAAALLQLPPADMHLICVAFYCHCLRSGSVRLFVVAVGRSKSVSRQTDGQKTRRVEKGERGRTWAQKRETDTGADTDTNVSVIACRPCSCLGDGNGDGDVLFMICQDFNPRKCVLNCSAYDKN